VFVCSVTVGDSVNVVSCSGRCEAEACSESEKLHREPPSVKRLSPLCLVYHWCNLTVWSGILPPDIEACDVLTTRLHT